MGGASCRGCVERRAIRPVGRRAVQQMGRPLRRLLGVSNKPVEGVEEAVGVMTMMMVMEKVEEVAVPDQQEQVEEEEAVVEAVEEAVEAEEVPLGEDLANLQTMDRIQTQNRTWAATLDDGSTGSGAEKGLGPWTFWLSKSTSCSRRSPRPSPKPRGISNPQTSIPSRETRRTLTDSSVS